MRRTDRNLLIFLYHVTRLTVAFVAISLGLHYAKILKLSAGKPAVWIFVGAFALFVHIYTMGELRRSKAPRRRNIPARDTGRQRQERQRANRTPFNTHQAACDKPVWRNIPGHATLLLDTNVLMCPDDIIRSWFGYLQHNAEKRDWRIVVHGAVYEEVMRHLKSGNPDKARDARLARNRIELMMDQLGEARFQTPEMRISSAKDADDTYADPKLIEYMLTHKRTFCFTFDNDLKIRCKQLLRAKKSQNRVFSEEDFYC